MKFNERYYLIAVLAFAVALAIGISFGFYLYEDQNSSGESSSEFLEGDSQIKSTIFIPGVNNAGQGIAAVLETSIREGSGFVLVNINDLDAGSSTQQSARSAARAAKSYLGFEDSGNEFDVTYNIKTNSPAIDGPSAGAAMAVSLISLLENKTLNDKVSITGFVTEDGIIGPASGIEQKASALNEEGIEILLVSDQVALPRDFMRRESCSPSNGKEYCEVNYIADKEIEISGIKVIPVTKLEDTLNYFYP